MGRPRKKDKDGNDIYNIQKMVKIIEAFTKEKYEKVPIILKACCFENNWDYNYVMKLMRKHPELKKATERLKIAREVNIELLATAGKMNVNYAMWLYKQMHSHDSDDLYNESNQEFAGLPAHVISRAFVDVNRQIDNNQYEEYWFEGGRGSTKSSFVALKIIDLIERNEDYSAMIIREVKDTIGDSVYAQIVWAIDTLNLTHKYKFIRSPFQITKISTGQKIFFRGADDPSKIKSIKPPQNTYIAIQWVEEFDQMKGMNAVRNIEQSLTRGGERIYKFKSYNTPKSATHFVNREKKIPKNTRLLHKSTYLETPIEWLGKPFFNEANWLKEHKPKAYAHEYMGEAIGDDGIVFDNIEIRTITEEEKLLPNRFQGIDWGFYPDPTHWGEIRYDSRERILYIINEYRCYKKSTKELYDILAERKNLNQDTLITADNNPPLNIADFRACGGFIKPTAKFPGSVAYSILWLARLQKIVISQDCIHTIEEFSEYELEKDRDGNYISVFPDKNNHAIDCIRYATQPIWKQRGQ